MVQSNQISPGMTLSISNKLYRVESSIRVTVPKGAPFIKTKLRDLSTNKIIEKNFKVGQTVDEAALDVKDLEFLYQEGSGYLFLDFINLDQVLVSAPIVGDKTNFLKEGTVVTASFYGDTVFSIELPQFLELMVAKTEGDEEEVAIANSNKMAVLETGAKVEVPSFIVVGDIIKVDTKSHEYIQRV